MGIAAELPAAYKKFWREWKVLKPAAVHFVSQEGRWRRDELTGETLPIQNVPFPLKHPSEIHEGIWGGEAIIKGDTKLIFVYITFAQLFTTACLATLYINLCNMYILR